jgi:hypothetical protein
MDEAEPNAVEPAAVEPDGPAPAPKKSRRLLLIIGGAVVALAIVASVVGIVIARSASTGSESDDIAAEDPSGSASGSPTPLATASPAPSVTPTEGPTSAPAPPAGKAVPGSCGDLYSSGMVATLHGSGVVLNPSWIYDPSQFDQVGTQVGSLQPILETSPKLSCTWITEGGGSEVGLTTEIVQVTSTQADQIVSTLTSIGWSRLDELGGVRFVVQQNMEGNAVGESQFLRDGLWFSTQYVNLAVNGYTADMVSNVFG